MIRRLFFEWRYLRRRAPWDTGQSPPELMEALQRLPPGKAIDLGCGTGTNLLTMMQHGWQVTGVDFSSQAIDRARRKLRRFGPQVQLIHGDVSRLPDLQGPFDLALDIGCFHSLPQESRQRYIANLGRWLRRGASYLLYTFLWQESDGSGWPGEADIVAMFARDFVPRDVTRGTEGDRISAWFTFERKPA